MEWDAAVGQWELCRSVTRDEQGLGDPDRAVEVN